jgi:hypothetical protein
VLCCVVLPLFLRTFKGEQNRAEPTLPSLYQYYLVVHAVSAVMSFSFVIYDTDGQSVECSELAGRVSCLAQTYFVVDLLILILTMPCHAVNELTKTDVF